MSLDDHRLRLRHHELVPLVIGGMGVNISTAELAVEAARLGGVGHISDAGIEAVADMRFGTKFVRRKFERHRASLNEADKSAVRFDLGAVVEAQGLHVARTMEAKRGEGLIFINCMERLTMNDPRGTLRARLAGAMDAGIDGITLSAGLHLKSLGLVQDHPRFHDVLFGIIVSSLRALKLFLRSAGRVGRMPDYIVVEGPLAGGHLAFGPDDWHEYDLRDIVVEVVRYLDDEGLQIPVIPAGGIFTGADALSFLAAGAAAVQVATRFTITEESGLPAHVKQEYLRAEED
ncbi:MAG: nitronate monooxygenase, partial [Acidobacteriota bacterium]